MDARGRGRRRRRSQARVPDGRGRRRVRSRQQRRRRLGRRARCCTRRARRARRARAARARRASPARPPTPPRRRSRRVCAWSAPSGAPDRRARRGRCRRRRAARHRVRRCRCATPLAAWCAAINGERRARRLRRRADGRGQRHGRARRPRRSTADCTVTFTAPKRGLVALPGRGAARARSSSPTSASRRASLEAVDAPEVWTAGELRARCCRVPAPDAHKNSAGACSSSRDRGAIPGAAVLAARGAHAHRARAT